MNRSKYTKLISPPIKLVKFCAKCETLTGTNGPLSAKPSSTMYGTSVMAAQVLFSIMCICICVHVHVCACAYVCMLYVHVYDM